MKFIIILSAILLFAVRPAWAQPAPITAPSEVTLPSGATSSMTAPTESTAAATRAVDARSNDFQDFGSLDLEALLNADVETASSRKEPISRAAAIIEILTRKQLYALGARDLYRALTFLPGIELLESFSGNTVLVFRGVLQDQFSVKVLLLLNGQPLYESLNKAFYLELIPLESIERIEVIRGPGSVLYGTNAFAGVVNVITRTRSEDGSESTVRLDGGHFTTGAFGAGNHGRSGELTWSLFSAGNYTRGYPYRVQKSQNRDCLDPNPPRPADCTGPGPSVTYPYFNNYVNAFGSIGYKGLTVQLGGMRQHRQQYAIAAIARFHGANEIDYAYGNLAYTHEWRRFRITARAGLDRADRTSNIGHFPGPTFPETDLTGVSYLGRANITASWTIVPSLTLDQGIGFERGFVAPETVGLFAEDGAHHPFSPLFDGTPEQTSLSYFNHANWAITDEFSTVAGYRVTHLTTNYLELTTDSTGIPQQHIVEEDPLLNHSVRGGVVWAPVESITFKLLFGSAFRAPSIAERVSIILQVVGTDPVIHPETTQTTEFGIDSRPLDWLSLRANGYVSVLRNLITRRPATPAEQPRFGARSVVYDNIPGSQRIIGSELSSTAIVNASTSIFFNASLKQARLMPESRILRESALLTVNGGISWQARPWLILRPNAQYLGPRKRSHAYTLVNAVIDFPVTDALTLSALGENLGNASYTYPEFGTSSDIRNLPGGPERSFYGRAVLEF